MRLHMVRCRLASRRVGWLNVNPSSHICSVVDHGIKKGPPQLSLGRPAVGAGSVVRPPRRDLMTGGGAFGVPVYAGMGASGSGWALHEDFDEFVDPPATVENTSTRAFSSHPSRPFFLVGSINTHIYLWEFGKDKATATYGVLPAPNVPPPYALASISAVQFDHCGHRFSSAALDGTVCTWQLEVGGRSNVCPSESSFCFNDHASDVSYVTSNGSVIAAAGYSSNSVNVVMWDTLAPPTSSQASIICHEGGARSISVFDNDIGSGSVSPIIITGGKNGDVGLRDFPKGTNNTTMVNLAAAHQPQSIIRTKCYGTSRKLTQIPNPHSCTVLTSLLPLEEERLPLSMILDGHSLRVGVRHTTKFVISVFISGSDSIISFPCSSEKFLREKSEADIRKLIRQLKSVLETGASLVSINFVVKEKEMVTEWGLTEGLVVSFPAEAVACKVKNDDFLEIGAVNLRDFRMKIVYLTRDGSEAGVFVRVKAVRRSESVGILYLNEEEKKEAQAQAVAISFLPGKNTFEGTFDLSWMMRFFFLYVGKLGLAAGLVKFGTSRNGVFMAVDIVGSRSSKIIMHAT